MLTLPSDITNHKNKILLKPIILVDFTDKFFYVATKSYTASGQAYLSLLQKNLSLNMRISLPQMVNEISSLSSPTLKLTTWRSNLRSNLVGSTPNLTDSTVDIYLKLDTSSTNKTDAVKIFSGVISSWSVDRDIMSIRLNNYFAFPQKIPQGLISDINVNSFSAKYAKPIQIGNFGWDTHPFLEYDRGLYAKCLLESFDKELNRAYWYIAKHEMNALPTDTQLEGTTNRHNSYAFVLRDNTFTHVVFDTNSVGTITNTSAGASIDVNLTSATCYLTRRMTEPGPDNSVINTANAYDGKDSSYALIEYGVHDTLDVKYPNFKNLTQNKPHINAVYGTMDIWFGIRFGTIEGAGTIYVYCNSGVAATSRAFDSADGDSWVVIYVNANNVHNYITNFQDFYTNHGARVKVELTSGENTFAQLKEVVVQTWVSDLEESDLSNFYLRCKGREYTDTWNSRKTIGNLIENPADVIEMLLRDELDVTTSDIDTASFDVVNNILSSVKARGTIWNQVSGKDMLNDICQMFNVSLIYLLIKKWRLVVPIPTGNNFSSSGTGTPGNEDIFTDSPIISGGAYDKHPILRDKFQLLRSSIKDVWSKVKIEFGYTENGYLFSEEMGSGDNIKIIENWLLGDPTSVITFLSLFSDWYLKQKMIVNFTTGYNAIAHEPGDIINVRHSELNDDIIDATVNTQKWMILEKAQSWRPNEIEIEAIELI